MIRVLLYFGLVGIIALGAAWFADRPGTIVLTWQGWRVETSLIVALVAIGLVVVALMLLWSLISLIVRGPESLSMFLRGRRRARGVQAVGRGLVAVGIGDSRRAAREAAEARRHLGDDPLALLLQAQSAQLSGDRGKAEAAFQALLDKPDTRSLGLRGLFVEAERRGDAETARRIAAEAALNAREASWALDALFAFACADGRWRDARDVLERLQSGRGIERKAADRRRAVLLTAEAQDMTGSNPEEARILALEAHRLAPDFVPAAAIAGRLLAEAGESRRAAKLVEQTWRKWPHPDLAEIYLHASPGETARERLKRAEALAVRAKGDPEGALTLARAAIEAREFGRAREALEPLLAATPTARTCMLMEEIEEGEHGDTGRAREWLSRALRAPGDPIWVADGVTSETWKPVSPVTGELDAFQWRVPQIPLAAGFAPTAALAATERLIAAGRADPLAERSEETVAADTAAALEASLVDATPMSLIETPPFPGEEASPLEDRPSEADPPVVIAESLVEPAPAPSSQGLHPVLPLPRLPDDPGPDGEEPIASRRAQLAQLR